jgi:ribosomal-protein-alanine N-acetyltransferase
MRPTARCGRASRLVSIASLIVSGPTLELRYATSADVPRLFELGADASVTRFFSWGPYASPDEAAAYVEASEGRRDRGEQLDFLIVHRADGPIGVTGLSELARRDRRATVGSWLGRPWWGSGANFESKALITALAFRRLGMHRLTAWANTRNGRSQAALERVGFRREGVLAAWHRHGEAYHDVVVFSLLASAWEGSALAGVDVAFDGAVPEAFVVG